MSDDVISNGKTTHDERSSGSGKLEAMSKEDLIKLVKNQIAFKKKLETKLNELTTSTTNFSQTEEQLRHQIDSERSKYSQLTIEFDQYRTNQSKLHEELNLTRKSLDDFRAQNETLKSTSQNLQDEITTLRNELSIVRLSPIDASQKLSSHAELLSNSISTTIELLQLPISLPDTIDDKFIQIYKNELEQKQDNIKQTFEQMEEEKAHLQQRIEDYEFLNEEMKLENDDLRSKSFKYQHDKQLQEKEIDNYRRQIEDFEEQFLELQRENRLITYDKSQQQPSITSSLVALPQSDENIDEIILQCMNYILNHIVNDHNQQISKASSTSSLLLSSDIPTLLHSVGIANCTDEDFSVPLDFESVLRLSTLLIERCRVLQYILLKKNDISMNSLVDNDYDNQCVSFIQKNEVEQCRILIHKQDHMALDTLFERIYTGMNRTISSDDWQIVIEKSMNQSTSPSLRLEFDNFKFVPEEIEHALLQVRSECNLLTQQNEQQRQAIAQLEKRLLSNNSIAQLKEYQLHLEKQLIEQCDKTIQLENLLKRENIDKTKFDQLEHIEHSYHELQDKFLIAEQLENQIKQLNEKFNEKDLQVKRQTDLFDKLKVDYDRQHFYILERDEQIRLLQLEIEQYERFQENLIDKYQKEFEQQKLLLLTVTQNQNQRYSSVSHEQHVELNDLMQMKINENKNLIEKNLQLENDLQQHSQLLREKSQRIDQLQKQLQALNLEGKESQRQYEQMKDDKMKLKNDIHSLMNQLTQLETERLEFIQNIDDLKQQLKTNKLIVEKSVETSNQVIEQETIQLQQTVENTTTDLASNTANHEDFQLHHSVNTNGPKETATVTHLQSELDTIRQDNQKLNQTIHELNDKFDKQLSDPGENIQEFKEKYHKMKVLLTRLKKELQDRNHAPKQSLIDLELADYDKTIQDLKDDLINKEKEGQDLREELSNCTNRYVCLKLEIENLEKQKLQSDQRANKFKALLEFAKKELQNAKELELQRYHNDDHVRVLIDKLQQELDSHKVLISELSNEKQQLIEKLTNHNEINQRTMNLLEQNLRIAKHDLDIAKKDYDTLQDDFGSYKIRAQSVLKQHQANQRERTPSLADKQAELEETIDKFKINLREANERIQSLIAENEALQKEQARLIEMQAKRMNESKKREQDLRKQHQVDIEKIENKYLQQINDSQDLMRTITLQNETLTIAYKEQVASLEADHERSRSIQQNQLETSQQEIEQLKHRLDLLQQTNIDHENLTPNSETTSIGIHDDPKRDCTLAWSASEHQQVEESESVNRNHQSSDSTIKTFENILLNNDNVIEHNTTSIPSSPTDQSPSIFNKDLELERQRLEEELNRTKLRLLDTAELLNESESNNLRLNEQVTLLKDEIRRIERNMDRAESISNLEYLKNIIVKFFILKSIPERLQLIPVLVTMLKLSPDEQAQLVRVANLPPISDDNFKSNESSIQQMTNGANSPSWSSYLNIW